MKPTEKQQEIIDIYIKHASEKGQFPSLSEIEKYYGIKKPAAYARIRALAKKGFLKKEGYRYKLVGYEFKITKEN